MLHGLADFTAGLLAGPFPGRWLTLVAGAFSVAAGMIVLFWPTISLIVLVAVMGIWLIVYGIFMAITAFGLRRGGLAASAAGRASA